MVEVKKEIITITNEVHKTMEDFITIYVVYKILKKKEENAGLPAAKSHRILI